MFRLDCHNFPVRNHGVCGDLVLINAELSGVLKFVGASMVCFAIVQIRRVALQVALVTWQGIAGSASAQSDVAPVAGDTGAAVTVIEKTHVGVVQLIYDPSAVAVSDTRRPVLPAWRNKTKVEVEPSAEHWVGVETYRRAVSLYSGLTWSPFTNLRQDGFRLRAVSGQSFYTYSGPRYDLVSNGGIWQQFAGSGRFLEALAGWQWSAGGTTAKAFVGYGQVSNILAPFDIETQIQGTARGLKGVVEIWQNWTPRLWSSLDVSEQSAHHIYSTQLRTGWRFDPVAHPAWSVGGEIFQFGHTEATLRRAGLFVRYENLQYEFTIAGGAARASNDSPMGYATAQYLRRF